MTGPTVLDSTSCPPSECGLDIRRMTRDEVPIAVDWAAEEGWNPGINDGDVFYHADPRGFFVALEEGEPVGCCSAVVYRRQFAFFGLFIVRPDCRGRGIGLQLTRAAMDYVGECNCGLDGVVAMQSRYAQFGYRLAYRNIRFEGEGDGQIHQNVVPLNTLPFDRVAECDLRHFSAQRREFLRHWLVQPGASALGYVSDGRLAGYGIRRPCRVGYKIGPLFAESDRVADALFQSLCSQNHGASVFLDVPEPNAKAMDLVRRYGMRPCFETARMYTQGTPEFPVDQVYGVTTFELG